MRAAVTALHPPAVPPAPTSANSDEPRHRAAARYLWVMLLARIYEAFPLACPICHAEMRIIAFIDEASTVKKILEHIGEGCGGTRRQRSAVGCVRPTRTGDRVRSAHCLVAGRDKINTSCRSSWNDSCLSPGKSPPAAPVRATGGDEGAIREVFWRIPMHSRAKSAIDRCGQGRRYSRMSR
jgi:hypothetical protein